ncbi:hypothetical protein BDR26DRAFT_863270 [Obelidium mucronatum]|nr:hypothetical protein BDR26DRAFT_863270 [Obelidium mucronatum]
MTTSKKDILSETQQERANGEASQPPPPAYDDAGASQSQPSFPLPTQAMPIFLQQQPPIVIGRPSQSHSQSGFVHHSGQTILTFHSGSQPPPSMYSHSHSHHSQHSDLEPLLPQTLVIDTTDSVLMFCPSTTCQTNVVSIVENAPGCLAYLTSAFLCLIGCGCCFCVPLLAPRCQDQVHRCPACRRVLAIVPA